MENEVKNEKILFAGKMVDEADARVHILAPALQYAAVVFEGMRAYWSDERQQLFLFRYKEHIERLELSMKMMRLDRPAAMETLKEDVLALVRENALKQDCHLRVFTLLDGPPNITATGPTFMAVTAGPFQPNAFLEKGMKAVVSSWNRIADKASPPRIKTIANYVNGRLAAMQAKHDGYDAPIMLTDAGYVSEGPQANILMVREGRLVSPRRTDGILESITRNTLLQLCRDELAIDVEERGIDRSELYAAEELFYCGSGWEIRPVTSVDGIPVGDGSVGPVTRRIAAGYFDCVRGKNARYEEWLTPVWQ